MSKMMSPSNLLLNQTKSNIPDISYVYQLVLTDSLPCLDFQSIIVLAAIEPVYIPCLVVASCA